MRWFPNNGMTAAVLGTPERQVPVKKQGGKCVLATTTIIQFDVNYQYFGRMTLNDP